MKTGLTQNKVVYHIISKALMLATKDQLSDYISDIPIKSTELASHMGYHPQAAQRLFNLLETLNLLEIVDEEFIIATELTPCIHQIYSEHFFGSFAAFNYFQSSLKSNAECWSEAHGQTFYEYLEDNPKKLSKFQLYLEETAECWLKFIPDVFDFSAYSKLVDIGGGKGQLLAKILEKNNHSNMTGVIFEKPELMSDAFNYLSDKNLMSKVLLIEGDFLKDKLPQGDIYILCRVLLNWDDENSIRIIRNCLKIMDEGQKLIIVDFAIPNKDHKQYQRALLHDLNLLALFGGKIRTVPDWKALVNRATEIKATVKIIDESINPHLNVPMVMIELTFRTIP